MKKAFRILNQYIYLLKWKFISFMWKFRNVSNNNSSSIPTHTQFSIGITTYIERFDTYLKPLVKRLSYLQPDQQIIVAINGYHDQKAQQKYIKEISDFLVGFINVKYFYHETPQSLSKLWNQIVIESDNEGIFIFNDDISISPQFAKDLASSPILGYDVALINGSFSHFFVKKSVIKKVGWFDERFPGIGYEDHDFEIRLTFNNIELKHFKFNSVKNENVTPKSWSWGETEDVIEKKYTKSNETHYFNKWSFSNNPKDGYQYVRITQNYVKLNEGMETPNFYPEIMLK